MSARRTEVTVDVLIGSVSFRGGHVEIPATIAGGGGGGGAGGGGGHDGGSGSTISGAAGIAGVFGQRGLQMQLRSLQALMGEVTAMGPQVAGIVAVAVGALGALYLHVKLSMFALQQLGNVAGTVLGALWAGTVKAAEGFVGLGEAIVGGTMQALWDFGAAVVQVMDQAAEAIADLVQKSAAYYGEFEQSIANAVAVLGEFGDAATVARNKFMDFAEATATRSRYGAAQIADALYQIASAGFAGHESLQQITDASLAFAGATISEVEPAAKTLSAALHAFSMDASQASRVADVFTQAINKSALQPQDLTEALRYAQPMARAFHISLEEMTASLEAFATVGLTGSMAGTTFRQVLNGLGRVSDKAKAQFRALGVDIEKFNPRTAGGLIAVVKMFEDLERRIGKVKVEDLISKSFEMRAQAGIFALLQTGSAQLEAFQGQLYEQGVAAKTAAEQLNTLEGAYLGLKNAWENAQVEIGRGGLGEGLKQVYLALREVVLLATQTGVFRKFGAVLGQVMDVARYVVQSLGGPLVDAISNIVGMLPDAVRKVGEEVAGVMPMLKDSIGGIPSAIKGFMDKMGPAVVKFGMIEKLSALLKLPIPFALKLVFALVPLPLLLKFITMALPMLINIFTTFVDVLTRFLSDNGTNIIEWFRMFLEGVLGLVSFLPQLLPSVQKLIMLFIQWAPYLIQTALNLLPLFKQALEALVPTLQQLAATALPAFMMLVQQLAGMLVSEGVPAIKEWVGVLIAMMTLIVDNWPAISSLMVTGLRLITNGMGYLTGFVAQAKGWVAMLLGYIAQHWPVIIGMAIRFLINLIDILKGLASGVRGPIASFYVFATIMEYVIKIVGIAVVVVYALGSALQTLVTAPITGWGEWLEDVKNVADGVIGIAHGLNETKQALWGMGTVAGEIARSNLPKDVQERLRRIGQDAGAPGFGSGEQMAPAGSAPVGPGAGAGAGIAPISYNPQGTPPPITVVADFGGGFEQRANMAWDERSRSYRQLSRVNGLVPT